MTTQGTVQQRIEPGSLDSYATKTRCALGFYIRLETPSQVRYAIWGQGWAMLRQLCSMPRKQRLRAMGSKFDADQAKGVKTRNASQLETARAARGVRQQVLQLKG